MKITKTQLRRIINEELGMIEGESEIENFPRVRKLIGDDLLDRTFAKMEELQAEMDSAYEMGGNRGGPYPKDSKLFLRALDALLGEEELENALNEEGVSPKELGLPLDVGTPEKLLQGLSVLLNNPEQIQKDQIGHILNLINKQLMKNPDEATGDALRDAKTKLIKLDPARSTMASSRAARGDKFRDEAESAYAGPAGGDFYSTGGARFEGKTKLTNSHLKLIVKEELEALLGEEELEEEEKMNIGKMHLKKGRCKHMGSEECPEGSPQYNLAKRFKSGDIHKANLKKGKNPHGPG